MNVIGIILIALACSIITIVAMIKVGDSNGKWITISFFCGGLLGIMLEYNIMSSKVFAEDYLKNTEQYQVDTISTNGVVDYYRVSKLKQYE